MTAMMESPLKLVKSTKQLGATTEPVAIGIAFVSLSLQWVQQLRPQAEAARGPGPAFYTFYSFTYLVVA